MSHKLAKTKEALSKLYDYLHGYEHAGFTGASKQDSLKSVAELIKDEVTLFFGEEESNSDSVNSIIELIDRYFTSFYNHMRESKRPSQVAWLADAMKKDSVMLSDLVSFIMTQSIDTECFFFLPMTRHGEIGNIQLDLSEKCPKYIARKCKFCLVNLFENSDGNNCIICDQKLPYTNQLVKAIFKVLDYLIVQKGISLKSLTAYQMIFQHILAASKIFELMNPLGSVRQDMIDNAKMLLTREPLDHNSATYLEWKALLYQVFDDVREGTKPYIRDMAAAIAKTRSYMDSPYDLQNDTYFSMKGSGQSRFSGRKESLLSSIYEVDYYGNLPEFIAFDEKTGYKSNYRKCDNIDLEKDKVYCIRTIMINNPGKFKGRIIHIFDNPIQDRCNYIQRRTAALLKELRTDCTTRQDNGRDFARESSLEWYLTKKEDKPGIYGFDFSNATDTLDQGFQWEVLNFLFGPEIANFWDRVSKLPKFIQNADGSYERYDQKCGQPQGGLSSFNGFALSHHFIFLMDMKYNHMENEDARNVYRVLGDDSIAIVRKESDIYDSNRILKYDESDPYNRSDFEYCHFRICNEFAGFIINYDKSHSVHYDSNEAKVDFAKVTFRNGGFFSPVPFRLVMRYANSLEDRLAVAIWRGARRESNAVQFMDTVLKRHCTDPIVSDLIHCGQMDYLDPFKTNEPFNESWLARVRYAYALSVISTNLSFLTLKDRERDWVTKDTWNLSLKGLFNRRLQADLNNLPNDHKAVQVIFSNMDTVDLLKCIYNEEDADDQFLALVVGTINKQIVQGDMIQVLEKLHNTSKMLRLAQANPDFDISMIFPDFNIGDIRNLRLISNNTLTRGISKRPREETIMFSIMRDTLKELDCVLGECPHTYC